MRVCDRSITVKCLISIINTCVIVCKTQNTETQENFLKSIFKHIKYFLKLSKFNTSVETLQKFDSAQSSNIQSKSVILDLFGSNCFLYVFTQRYSCSDTGC